MRPSLHQQAPSATCGKLFCLHKCVTTMPLKTPSETPPIDSTYCSSVRLIRNVSAVATIVGTVVLLNIIGLMVLVGEYSSYWFMMSLERSCLGGFCTSRVGYAIWGTLFSVLSVVLEILGRELLADLQKYERQSQQPRGSPEVREWPTKKKNRRSKNATMIIEQIDQFTFNRSQITTIRYHSELLLADWKSNIKYQKSNAQERTPIGRY
ncbi:hypothetical protein K457DRAFT_125987 [Linnemannia elongata AG-77]|uniref:Uncharacterized protein n=1 Tax=Linnemannia elongata AG-77 TaxID=1314771 RepID=A0A197JXT3_9FUNG|nr:hypothetical protein K457DRAFT_125987 [Linnemannia elongata AG-77]